MRRLIHVTFILLTVLSVAVVPVLGAEHPRRFTSDKDVHYRVSIDEDNYTLSVRMTNPNDHAVNASYLIRIDNRTAIHGSTHINEGSTESDVVPLRRGIDAQRDVHNISIGTFGGGATFQFRRNLSLLHPGKVPVPYISNVTVVNGSFREDPTNHTSVVRVEIRSPSKRGFVPAVLVSTLGTEGSGWVSDIGTGSNDTVNVSITEPPGVRTAGEVRLYAQPPDGPRYPIDQVGFVGEAGNGTEWWNESYETVRPPWKNDSYQYTNSSLTWWHSKPTTMDRVRNQAPVIVGGLVALAAVLLGYRRLR